jgi:hypothetical protein
MFPDIPNEGDPPFDPEITPIKCETCEENARAARNLSPDLKFEQ